MVKKGVARYGEQTGAGCAVLDPQDVAERARSGGGCGGRRSGAKVAAPSVTCMSLSKRIQAGGCVIFAAMSPPPKT